MCVCVCEPNLIRTSFKKVISFDGRTLFLRFFCFVVFICFDTIEHAANNIRLWAQVNVGNLGATEKCRIPQEIPMKMPFLITRRNST